MTALSIIEAGLQAISSCLTSLMAVLILFVFVVAGLAAVEVLIGRGGLARAYTVKTASCEEHGVSARPSRLS
jgi:hypothetical protein